MHKCESQHQLRQKHTHTINSEIFFSKYKSTDKQKWQWVEWYDEKKAFTVLKSTLSLERDERACDFLSVVINTIYRFHSLYCIQCDSSKQQQQQKRFALKSNLDPFSLCCCRWFSFLYVAPSTSRFMIFFFVAACKCYFDFNDWPLSLSYQPVCFTNVAFLLITLCHIELKVKRIRLNLDSKIDFRIIQNRMIFFLLFCARNFHFKVKYSWANFFLHLKHGECVYVYFTDIVTLDLNAFTVMHARLNDTEMLLDIWFIWIWLDFKMIEHSNGHLLSVTA